MLLIYNNFLQKFNVLVEDLKKSDYELRKSITTIFINLSKFTIILSMTIYSKWSFLSYF